MATTRPILIAQISDLHIVEPGALAYGRVDTAAALRRTVATLNGLTPRPDLVVISGDVADTPRAAEYRHARDLLSALAIPYVAIPGNHDIRALMRAGFPDLGLARSSGAMNAVHAVGDLDIVLLDSTVPDQSHGLLDDETLAWLEATLHASSTRPALLFLHHPPFVTGIGYMDDIRLRNADALAALLHRHERVRLIAAGHVHRAAQTVFAGRAATICPAGEQACALDFDGGLGSVFMTEPQQFHLHTWFPGADFGTLVTHLVPVGAIGGPFPFQPAGAATP